MEWRISVYPVGEEDREITTNDIKDVGDVVSRELHRDPWANIEIETIQEGQ